MIDKDHGDRCPRCGDVLGGRLDQPLLTAKGKRRRYTCGTFVTASGEVKQSPTCRANAAERDLKVERDTAEDLAGACVSLRARVRDLEELLSIEGNHADICLAQRNSARVERDAHARRLREIKAWHKKYFPGYYSPVSSEPLFDHRGKLVGRRPLEDTPPLVGRDAEFCALLDGADLPEPAPCAECESKQRVIGTAVEWAVDVLATPGDGYANKMFEEMREGLLAILRDGESWGT